MWTDKVHQFIFNPICGLLVTLIFSAIALSGRFSVNLSNLLLIAALLIGCFEIFRLGQAIHLNIILCLLLGIILTAISWWIEPNPQTKQSTEKSAIQQQQQVSKELFSQNFPGISFQALIKLNDVSANRRKYLVDFGRVDGSRLSVYISSDNVFTFSFIDTEGEQYNIKLPIGSNGIPFGKLFYLICELGIDGQSTLLRMLIDGKEIETKHLQFKVDLGGIDVPGGVLGADLNGDNGASFDEGTEIVLKETMTSSQIAVVTKMILDYYQSSERHFLRFNGKQWKRINITDLHNPVKNNKVFLLNDPNFAVKLNKTKGQPHITVKDRSDLLFQPETIAQINRIIADGGTIIDAQWMDTVIRTLKSQDLYILSGNNNDATRKNK